MVCFIDWNGRERTAGEYRGLDRKSAYLSGGYRIGMVQLIKWKGSEWIGDDQNSIESRIGDLNGMVSLFKNRGTERISKQRTGKDWLFNLLNGK